MKYILTSEEMKSCDDFTIKNIHPSIELMEEAGKNCFFKIKEYINKEEKILVVSGGGGNGGDGLVIARYLYESGYNVKVFLSSNHLKEETSINKNKYKGKFITLEEFKESQPHIIVDALLGANLNKPLNQNSKEIINLINSKNAKVFSIDINSGIDASNGVSLGAFVKSFLTIGIESYKIGHFFLDGFLSYEKLDLVSANVSLVEKEKYIKSLEIVEICRVFEKRSKNSNKGSYGKVALLGGSKLTPGALILSSSSLASLRMGVGYSRVFVPRSLYSVYALRNPENIYETFLDEDGSYIFAVDEAKKLLSYDAIALGMGIGTSKEVYKLIEYLVLNYEGNLLLDADALNSLSRFGTLNIFKNKKCYSITLTPHIKEFSRLIKNDDITYIKENAIFLAKDFALKFGVILDLKDAVSVISDGKETYLNINGNPSLAKGGSGDILSGIIVGLLTKKDNLTFRVATGSYLLGLASDLAIKENNEYTLIARDIVEYLKKAINLVTINK